MDRRGQAFTLEAILAAVLLVSSLAFALQATAVTPASTGASANPEVQRASVAAGVLDATVADGSAERAVLAWNGSRDGFDGATEKGYFVDGGPPNAFGETLDNSLGSDAVAYNVELQYLTRDGGVETETLVSQGTPSDRATRVVRTVTLSDDDGITRLDGSQTAVTLENATTFYAPDVAPDSDLYNVVRVEVIVWSS